MTELLLKKACHIEYNEVREKEKRYRTVELITEETKHVNTGLYNKQMELLKTFLDRNAITKEQYEKSVKYLNENMVKGNE